MDVKATMVQIEEFKESLLWKDFIDELNEWKEGFISELLSIAPIAEEEKPSTASVLLHLGDVSGRIKAIDYMLGLPDMFIEMIEEKARQTKNDSEVS